MSIRRVRFSELDIKNLASKVPPEEPIDRVTDFSKYLVQKPWGSEYLMFYNDFVEIWSLNIKQDQTTSTHCHPNKKTALILLSGEAVFTTLNGDLHLKPLDAVVIEAGVFHSTKAVSPEGIKLIEVETPPAKHDLIRLRDKYGREGLSYEGLNKMTVSEGECIRFPQVSDGDTVENQLEFSRLCIKKIGPHDLKGLDDKHSNYLSDWDLLIVLEGVIYGPENDEIYGVAEVLRAEDILTTKDQNKIFNLTVMGIKDESLTEQSKQVEKKKASRSLMSKIISR